MSPRTATYKVPLMILLLVAAEVLRISVTSVHIMKIEGGSYATLFCVPEILQIRETMATSTTPMWPINFTNGKRCSREEDYYALKIHI
eukprot:COSAG01_NODE_14565_length_1437_cov_8.120329_3_plen_88_part_00